LIDDDDDQSLGRPLVSCLLAASYPEIPAPRQTASVSMTSAHAQRDTSLLPAAVVSSAVR